MAKNKSYAAVEHLRLKHLRLLELLVEHGTVRKAAEQLHVSQPVASQMLAEVETAFEGALFTRNRSGVQPTARLGVLIRRSRLALGEIAAASAELSSIAQPVIRIGANLQFLTQLLPSALADMQESNPELRFFLEEGPSDRLVAALLEGNLDCVVARHSTRAIRDATSAGELQFWPLGDGRLCLVVGHAHPLAHRRRIKVRDLAGEKWALGTREGQGRDIINRLFLDAGLQPPQPVIECRPQFANLAFAARMPLITVATRADAQAGVRAGLLHILPIDISQKLAPISFVCRKAASKEKWLVQLHQAMKAAADREKFA